MNTALKEWSVVVEALARGDQLFLLRKGGIAEGKRGFEPKFSEFLFFPTWEHQHRDSVRPEFRELFHQLRPRDPETIEIPYLAQVTDVMKAPPSAAEMTALKKHHIYTDSFIVKRYDYRSDLPLFVLVVRLSRLAKPQKIPLDRKYAGCRSWVTLLHDVPVAGSEPVVPEPSFRQARDELLSRLGQQET